MANTTFQQGRKPKNTWLAGKIKCGHCGYALKATHVPNSTGYFRCTKRTENKGCPGCGKIRKEEFEQFIFSAMQEKFKDFQILHGQEEKVNPKLAAYQVELAQVEAEIEKLLDTLTGANATLLAYANKKIEELDTRRQTISKAIADLSVETISPQQIKKLSYYLDNWESIDFDDKRKQRPCSDRVENLTFPLYRPSFLFYLVCTPCTPMLVLIKSFILTSSSALFWVISRLAIA